MSDTDGAGGRHAPAKVTGDSSDGYFAQMLAAVPALMFGIDAKGNIAFASRDASTRLRVDPGTLRGSPFSWLFASEDSFAIEHALADAFTGVAIPPTVEARLATSAGEFATVRLRLDAVAVPGEPPLVLAVCEDRTEVEAAREALASRTALDALTALPNREALEAQLAAELDAAGRRDASLALLLIDVSGLRGINDTFGRAGGNEVLRQSAQRIRERIRGTDFLARADGDKFAVILPAVAGPEGITTVARSVIAGLEPPLEIANRKVSPGYSIGVSVFPDDGFGADDLLKYADIAMHRAREAGRNQCRLYSHDMSARLHSRLARETALRLAVERGDLRLAYQPVVDLRSGRIASLEALVRWQASSADVLLPGEFLSLAEEAGLMVDITDWVLRNALPFAQQLREEGHALRVAVNLSSKELAGRTRLPERLEAALASAALPAEALELEVSESAFAGDSPGLRDSLAALAAQGLRLTLDDFGVGVSSLVALFDRPVHQLKLCGSLIAGIDVDARRQDVVRALLAIGHSLHIECVAKSVGQATQLAQLRALGVRKAQGFALAAPLRGDEIRALLAAGKPLAGPAAAASQPAPPAAGATQGTDDPHAAASH